MLGLIQWLILGKPLLYSDQWRIRPGGPQECLGSFSDLSDHRRDRRDARSLDILVSKKSPSE